MPEEKQSWVVELGEDRYGAKEAASSMGDEDVQGMFADAKGVTVRFKKKTPQNLLNSVGAARRPSLSLLSMVIPWHTDHLV